MSTTSEGPPLQDGLRDLHSILTGVNIHRRFSLWALERHGHVGCPIRTGCLVAVRTALTGQFSRKQWVLLRPQRHRVVDTKLGFDLPVYQKPRAFEPAVGSTTRMSGQMLRSL